MDKKWFSEDMSLIVSSPNPVVRSILEDMHANIDIVDWAFEGPAPVDHIDLVISAFLSASPDYSYLESADFSYLQTTSLGYDHILPHLSANQVLANAKSVHETATAELTMALLLGSLRGLRRSVTAQNEGRWDQFFSVGLADKRVVVVGIGGVGSAIIDRLKPFEVEIVRVASTERDDADGHIYGVDQLESLLPDADVVILILPATEQTKGMVDDEFLGRMKDGALLLNMARGSIVDTQALVKHADRLLVSFDVVDPEPLPDGHPLFTHPNVLMTGHNGGYSDALEPRLRSLLNRQIKHLLAGEELENVIIRER